MTQAQRLPRGGHIDRDRPIAFSFNDRPLQGYEGDTLASALLANGVKLVARSFKYHRPRGVVGHGAEEPNALVRLGGRGGEPNARATQVRLQPGLRASSQNCWPSVEFDVGAVNNLLSRLLPAGFYYKTFMWPASLWMTYERLIRKSAGLGQVPAGEDPNRYLHRHEHCDVLIVGAGPAGLAAALAAGRAGARVVLAEQDFRLGGQLLCEDVLIDNQPAIQWIARAECELRALPNVRVLCQATVFGYFDHNLLGVEERVPAGEGQVCRLWKVRAARVILACGAIERTLAFANNDLPGVLLAHSAHVYLNRFAVHPGRRVVVFANNDSAYPAAADLAREASVTLLDVRADVSPHLCQLMERSGVRLRAGELIVRAHGGKHVAAVDVMRISNAVNGPGIGGTSERIDCDLVCMSGGWNPAVHLFSQSKGKLAFDPQLQTFVPERATQPVRCAGASAGKFDLAACLADGHAAGLDAAASAGAQPENAVSPPAVASESAHSAPQPWWSPGALIAKREKCFVDLQNDVTVGDIQLAAREGYVSVEHLKRYTTLGMGTDQGKLSNITGLAILAQTLGVEPGSVGTTTFRPPYTPVTFGTLAGAERDHHFAPLRRSAMDSWHAAAGAIFVNAGLWRRPQAYPRPGESMNDAINREALGVRRGVGLVDVSTLGKIDIKGADAVEFLERVYTNRWKKLPIGRVRYGLMLREDGMVYDDGTTARLGEFHYLMTTTTANAVKVMSTLEQLLQVHWQDLRVSLTSVTEHWAAMALSGPQARAVLERLEPGQDWGAEALPHLGLRESMLGGIPARVFRISYSGELAFEVNVPADHGLRTWKALLDAGEPMGIGAYGTEAMGILRIEKGHVAGPELDGRTTPDDLGLGELASKAGDFIGRRSLRRPAMRDPARRQLVGVVPADGSTPIPRGAQLTPSPDALAHTKVEGHVTSGCWSPNLGKPIALALLSGGRARHGETLWAVAPLSGESVQVRVGAPVFLDPEGERVRA